MPRQNLLGFFSFTEQSKRVVIQLYNYIKKNIAFAILIFSNAFELQKSILKNRGHYFKPKIKKATLSSCLASFVRIWCFSVAPQQSLVLPHRQGKCTTIFVPSQRKIKCFYSPLEKVIFTLCCNITFSWSSSRGWSK